MRKRGVAPGPRVAGTSLPWTLRLALAALRRFASRGLKDRTEIQHPAMDSRRWRVARPSSTVREVTNTKGHRRCGFGFSQPARPTHSDAPKGCLHLVAENLSLRYLQRGSAVGLQSSV